MKKVTLIISLFWLLSCFLSAAVAKDTDPATSLSELLEKVRQIGTEESKQNKERETEFLRQKIRQRDLLRQAKSELGTEEHYGNSIKKQFDLNQKKLADQQELLNKRMGNLGELIGVVRQVAGDTAGIFENSLVSAQFKHRSEFVKALSKQTNLPSIKQLQQLWFALQQEMTESAQVVKFPGQIIRADGGEKDVSIVRVGVFNVISQGKFLRYISETDQLIELPRQPASRFQSMAKDLEKAQDGLIEMAIDPSRGVILSMLVQAPDMFERVRQGKLIGYIIIAIAVIGLIMVFARFYSLTIAESKINAQLASPAPNIDNPLGRVMSVYTNNRDSEIELLERKIDEAILKEVPQLERGLAIIKILAVISPLLGLLGTVTGMIETFQSITLFGTGDPKLMAGGISQALVTTMLGLIAATPLILLHSIVSGKSKRCVNILEEQSAGMIAAHSEMA